MKTGPVRRTAYLVGVKHTGKSHVGRLLASRLRRPFLDLDHLVEHIHEEETGERLTVREIYRLDGGATFARLELYACRRALAQEPAPVVATGGGICDNPRAVELLRTGLIVALNAETDILFARMMNGGIPAFLAARTREDALHEFATLHRRRWAMYNELADIVVDTSSLNPHECAGQIAAKIKELW